MDIDAPRAVGGHRLTWPDLPPRLRDAIQTAVGSPVVAAESRPGGFSPAMASVLMLADGRSVFAKAGNTSRSEFAHDAIRREAQVLAHLPEHIPAPRPHWTYDDGGWVALVTDAVDGRNPHQPWHDDELRRFLDAAYELAHLLSPSPITASALADDTDTFQRWTKLAADPAAGARLDPWPRRHLDRLAELEQSWPHATDGTSLLHGDFRADNFLLTRAGFMVVDWPSVRSGPSWFDLVAALPSIAMHGGGDPDHLWLAHPLSQGVDPGIIDTVLAAIAGYFIDSSMQPSVPLAPTIRRFQRAQGLVTLAWLHGRTGWR